MTFACACKNTDCNSKSILSFYKAVEFISCYAKFLKFPIQVELIDSTDRQFLGHTWYTLVSRKQVCNSELESDTFLFY